MKQTLKINGLNKLGNYLHQFLEKSEENYTHDEVELATIIRKSETENPWFTKENVLFCLKNWAEILTLENINNWTSK